MRIPHRLSNLPACIGLASLQSGRVAGAVKGGAANKTDGAIRLTTGLAGAALAVLVGYAIGWRNGGHSAGFIGALLATAIFCASYGARQEGPD